MNARTIKRLRTDRKRRVRKPKREYVVVDQATEDTEEGLRAVAAWLAALGVP